MNRNELKVGMITKRSQQIKSFSPSNFKERVFVLTQEKIAYYEGSVEKRGKLKGVVILKDITYVGLLSDEALNRTSAFQIRHKGFYLYCCAKSLDDRLNWVNAIQQACGASGIQLQKRYHLRIFSGGKWQCCHNNDKSSVGCRSNSFTKPLPPLPQSSQECPPSPPIRRVSTHNESYEVFICLYDFKPQRNDDLHLEAGQKYKVIKSSQQHWWYVENSKGERGYAPENYLKKLEDTQNINEKWYIGDCSRTNAESRLLSDGREGTFVVRNSNQMPGQFTLSLVTRNGEPTNPASVKHYRIQSSSEGYHLSSDHKLPSLCELINYHFHNSAGLSTRLRQAPNDYKTPKLFNDSRWLIDFNEIQILSELGSGQFGVVKLGKIGNELVAVKIMKQGSMEESSFIDEAEVMANMDHPHLVKLFGIVTSRPICIVTEFMEHKSLLDYLRKYKSLVDYPETLLNISKQVCNGMKYLEQKCIIHRDLAARNCLVGRNNVVKVADFGLSRFVPEDEYNASAGAKFPIKWSAIEVLHYAKFSSKSDVWSFGILLWEIFSGGKTPYPGATNREVIDFVDKGHRLNRPLKCSHDVYSLMMSCWLENSASRPNFNFIFEKLENLIDNININIQAVEDYHS